jgi:hypothetical protein
VKSKNISSFVHEIRLEGNKVKIRNNVRRKKRIQQSGPEPLTGDINQCSKNKGFGDEREQEAERKSC